MENKLIKTYNFFEGLEKGSQDKKLAEESEEEKEAYANYLIRPNKENFVLLLEENLDKLNLLCQKAIVEHGISLREVEAMFNYKVNRTRTIIGIMLVTGETYDEVRRMNL